MAKARVAFAGEPHKHLEWNAETLPHLRISVDKRSDGWTRWAQTQKQEVTESSENKHPQRKDFPSVLKSELTTCCLSNPLHTLEAVMIALDSEH